MGIAALALAPGLALGSFLNVVAARLPLRRSLVSPGSACMDCAHEIAWYDNVPILSYALLRGRCRAWGVHIPVRSPAVELVAGILFAASFWKFGLTGTAAVAAFFCLTLVAETATSVRQKKAATAAVPVSPNFQKEAAKRIPATSSTAGERTGMCTPHARQRPRRSAYERIGTLSYHAISCAQSMQAEPGLTSERRSGSLAATTFRNEPRARPGARASAAIPIALPLSAAGGRLLSPA